MGVHPRLLVHVVSLVRRPRGRAGQPLAAWFIAPGVLIRTWMGLPPNDDRLRTVGHLVLSVATVCGVKRSANFATRRCSRFGT
jgi:hypothetical protein